MSAIREIGECKVSVAIKPKESLLLSAARDAVTFSFLLLCIYTSQGSTWWTFCTGVIFLLWVSARFVGQFNKMVKVFATPSEAINYLEKISAEAEQSN